MAKKKSTANEKQFIAFDNYTELVIGRGSRNQVLDLIEMHVEEEGYELEVLKGAKKTIEESYPDILVETHLGIGIEDVQALLPNKYSYEKVSFETHYLFTVNE